MEYIFKVLQNFGEYHYKFTVNDFAKLSNDEKIKYADQITVNNVNEDWLKKQLTKTYDLMINDPEKFKEEIKFENINITSYGNTAYISLKCNDEQVSKKAHELLDVMISIHSKKKF